MQQPPNLPQPENLAQQLEELAALQSEEQVLVQQPSLGDQPWSPDLVVTLGMAILAYGLITSLLMAYLLRLNKTPSLVLRTFSVPLIVTVSVFLIVVGFSSEQITPVIGLLGTIAGYLLGKSDDSTTGTGGQ